MTPETSSPAVLVNKSLRHDLQREVRKLATVCCLCWVIGACVFGVVELLRTDVAHGTNVSSPTRPHYLALEAAGGATFVAGSAGSWGSLHLEHGMVCAFSYIVFICSIVELSMGAVMISFSGNAVRQETRTFVKNSVDEERDSIFDIQKQLKCCGSKSPADWVDSDWWKRERANKTSRVVPHSCCLEEGRKQKKCQEGSPPFTEVDNPGLIFQQGCHSIVVERRRHLLLSSGIVCCLCGVAKLASFFAIHYFANVIIAKQQILDELKSRQPSSGQNQEM